MQSSTYICAHDDVALLAHRNIPNIPYLSSYCILCSMSCWSLLQVFRQNIQEDWEGHKHTNLSAVPCRACGSHLPSLANHLHHPLARSAQQASQHLEQTGQHAMVSSVNMLVFSSSLHAIHIQITSIGRKWLLCLCRSCKLLLALST